MTITLQLLSFERIERKKKNLLLKITFKINDSICDSVITEYLFPYSCLTSQLQSHDVSVNKHFKTEKRNY